MHGMFAVVGVALCTICLHASALQYSNGAFDARCTYPKSPFCSTAVQFWVHWWPIGAKITTNQAGQLHQTGSQLSSARLDEATAPGRDQALCLSVGTSGVRCCYVVLQQLARTLPSAAGKIRKYSPCPALVKSSEPSQRHVYQLALLTVSSSRVAKSCAATLTAATRLQVTAPKVSCGGTRAD